MNAYPETSKVLSIQYPWPLFILYPQIFTYRGKIAKTIENRQSDITKGYRGQVFLHIGLNPSSNFYDDGWLVDARIPEQMKAQLPDHYAKWISLMAEQFGGIIGCAQIVDVLPPNSKCKNPWYVPGQYGIVLEQPQPLPFFKCSGKPWLFDIPVGPIFENLKARCCCCSFPNAQCHCASTCCPGCGNCKMDCMCGVFSDTYPGRITV